MKLYVIAGEASGDLLGAKLIRALKSQRPDLELRGIGGTSMAAEGLNSLFPMRDLSLFGMVEVLVHVPTIFRRIRETLADIEAEKPDAVITIDVPGFSFRVAERLHKSGNKVKLIHYVAPTVWAYKPHRAAMMQQWYDLLLLLLPFEPPYFDAVNLPNRFVGHPIVEDAIVTKEVNAVPQLLLLPGSRRGEIKRHLPVFEETLKRLPMHVESTLVTLPELKAEIEDATRHWATPPRIICTPEERAKAFASATLALTKSGTVALELALHRIPMVVTYRLSAITAFILKRTVKVKYVNLVNLLLDKPAIPELLQEQCAPEPLAAAIAQLLNDPSAIAAQLQAMHEALRQLGLGKSPSPSQQAASAILQLLDKNPAPA